MQRVTVTVLSATRNHGAFIDAAIESVRAQTHRDWTMHVLDDGSTDDTVARVEAWCARDARITLHRAPSPPSGPLGAYLQLLALAPRGHDVALLDGDDVWLPTHLEQTLAELTPATDTSRADGAPTNATPTLVHGDLALIDADARVIAPSLWRAAGLDPHPATLRRLAIDNTVTGSTIVMNAALVAALVARRPPSRAGTTHGDDRDTAPPLYQDSWFALAAAALGTIVSRPAVTVHYRQHGHNLVGAAPRSAPGIGELSPRELIARVSAARRNTARLRRDLARSYAQAEAFGSAFHDVLHADDRAFLARYAAIARMPQPLRAWRLFTMRRSPSASVLRRLGEALRG